MMLFHHTNAPSATGKKNHSLNAALRRAFTITELVIVIAVIAILAAVLIPTFTSLVNRANESADIQTVKNLNTILSSNEAMGDRADTIDEALQQALDGGYKVENLTPTGDGYDIVWDATNNRFALVDGENKKVYGDALTPETISGQEYWKITDDYNKTSDNNFSWYLTEDAQLPIDSASGSLEVNSSMDLSAFPELESVTIPDNATGTINLTTNSEDVNIRLGATTASTATVNLYGTAGTVGVQNQNGTMTGGQYGMNSLHVFGAVDRILVRSGKVVAETGSTIKTIIATDPMFSNPVSIVLEDGASVTNIGTSTIYNLPFTPTATTCALKNAVSGATSSTEIITDRCIQSFYDNGIGTQEDPYIITNLQQFLDSKVSKFIDSYFASNTVYFKLGADLELTSRYATSLSYMNLDLNGHTITLNIPNDVDDGFHVQSNCQLTITGNGKIETQGTSQTDYIFAVLGNGKLIIENGTFIGGISVVQIQDTAIAEVYGGDFSVLNMQDDVYYVLNYIDSSINTAKITVYGGTFTNFDPSHPNEPENITLLPDSGYKVESTTDATNKTYYTVVAA